MNINDTIITIITITITIITIIITILTIIITIIIIIIITIILTTLTIITIKTTFPSYLVDHDSLRIRIMDGNKHAKKIDRVPANSEVGRGRKSGRRRRHLRERRP